MIKHPRNLVLLAVIAAAMLPAAAARAQWYGSPYAQPAPLYPYAVRGDEPGPVGVAPNSYVIRPPYRMRAYPYVHCLDGCGRRAPIMEWRKPDRINRTVINTTTIVRDPPVVVETQRVVDDPPRVIERRHIIEDETVGSRRNQPTVAESDGNKRASRDDSKKRVIEADAEITIIGTDRMNIRLFRKGLAPKANGRAE
jgi:hypothetical protein